jgi:PAS domain S-box-containing protein
MVQDMMKMCLNGQTTTNFEIDIVTKFGATRRLVLGVRARRDSQNNTVGVVAMAHDVTEACMRFHTVSGIALALRQLTGNSNTPIFGVDTIGKINAWNSCMESIMGFTKEDAVGTSLESFLDPSMQSKTLQLLESTLYGNEASKQEIIFRSKSGEPRYLNVHAVNRRNANGLIVGGK